MKHTYFTIMIIASCFFASCEQKDESAKATASTINLGPAESDKGAIPDWHPINMMLLKAGQYTFQEVHAMYKKDIENVRGKDYTSNLKNFGFRLAMETGLLKDGTNEEKKFYLDEQMGIDVNVLTFDDFYLLLAKSRAFLGLKAANAYSNAFYAKNNEQIQTFLVDDNKKKELVSRLDKARALYDDNN